MRWVVGELLSIQDLSQCHGENIHDDHGESKEDRDLGRDENFRPRVGD